MTLRYAIGSIILLAGSTSCGKPADAPLGANIAAALSDRAGAAQGAPDGNAAIAAAPIEPDRDDGLNSEMSEAANMSVAIGSIQGVVDGSDPDPDAAGAAKAAPGSTN